MTSLQDALAASWIAAFILTRPVYVVYGHHLRKYRRDLAAERHRSRLWVFLLYKAPVDRRKYSKQGQYGVEILRVLAGIQIVLVFIAVLSAVLS